MTVVTRNTGSTVALALEGVVDTAESPRLRQLLADSLRLGKRLVVDCSRVIRVDSAIIANLVEALAVARRNGTDLALAAVPPAVMALLELSRLDGVFPIDDQTVA